VSGPHTRRPAAPAVDVGRRAVPWLPRVGRAAAAPARALVVAALSLLWTTAGAVGWQPLPGYPGVWWSLTPPVSVEGGTVFCPGPEGDPGTCLVYANGQGPVVVDGKPLRYQTWLPTIISAQPQGAGAERQRERPATG
jgi:hypothetical protein